MTEPSFDALLKRMSEIASAVNAFSSEIVQAEAFAALVVAFGDHGDGSRVRRAEEGRAPQFGKSATSEDEVASDRSNAPRPATVQKRREGASASRVEWKMIKDLNIRPDGKTAFVDFVAQKQPSSNEEKYVVVVHYLEHVLGLAKVTIDHIGSVFRMMPAWREPGNLASGLRNTALRKATIDTSDRDDIKTTPQGRNFVEHDLPAETKPKQ